MWVNDALGQRIEVTCPVCRAAVSRVHGISYVDERLMMMDFKDTGDWDDDRPYYYTIDRMYNVRALIDRAGALVERYAYDPYGRPLIRESVGRGDMDDDTDMDSTDSGRVSSAISGSIWDPRGDMDDDGDTDLTDRTLYMSKDNNWPPQSTSTVVAQAFSDVGNPFMFQGRPHFAIDTTASDTSGKLMLNDHRARFNDPVTGRWVTRDPRDYYRKRLSPKFPSTQRIPRYPIAEPDRNTAQHARNSYRTPIDQKQLYLLVQSSPVNLMDPSGLFSYSSWGCPCCLGMYSCLALKCAIIPCGFYESVSYHIIECEGMGHEAADYYVAEGGDPQFHAGIRHCVASGCLAHNSGVDCAKCLGEVREDFQQKCSNQSQTNTDRGNFNNSVGRDCADTNAIPEPTMDEIQQCCFEAAANGDLWGEDENEPPNPAD